MSTTQYAQSPEFRLFLTRWLYILVAAVGLVRAVSTQAVGVYFQNSYGLVSPSNTVTFSEFSPPPNTTITTEYQPYGVTFVPYVKYASIYNQTSGTPHIDPTACVANFVQYGAVVPTFSIVFDRPVSAAAFAVLSQPGTFQVTALWAGIAVPGGPVTFTGGYGPDRTNNFVGLSGVAFDELRISNIATSDGALVLDNLQFTPALVNSWTNLHSARWDSLTNWSLATLPASNQTVYIVNDGYKAVDLDSATFPASVTVNNLFVAAPTNALSTLLLNYAGLYTPLKVLNNCVIGTNGTIDNFSSSFEVDGNAGGQLLVDGGAFTQVGGLTVVNAPVFVRSGSLNSTNGNLTLGAVTLGDVPRGATSSAGNFNQSGGSIAVASVSIRQGSYNLYDGILYALGGTYPSAGTFNQYGGTNFGDVYMDSSYPSNYRLLGGLLRGTNITANYYTIFSQGGGEAQAGLVTLSGQGYQSTPNYFLTNGVLRIGTLSIHSSSFLQMNGQVIITNPLSIYGYDFPIVHSGVSVYPANYTMLAGTLSCPSLTVTQYDAYTQGPYASFTQSGGTNIIAGELSLDGATYSLDGGGLLQTSNSFLTSGAAAQGVSSSAGVFQHQSGAHNVTGTLSIDLGSRYYINGGTLSVGQMWMHGMLVIGNNNGTPTVSCSGLLDLGGFAVLPGVVQVQAGTHHLGSLRLTGNSSLNFGNGPATVNFDSSSSIGWSNGVSLAISGWNNSGNVHIFFGSSGSGLSASQLRQITFSNPGGFLSGNYPAQLLSTGELVPAPRPMLQSARNGSALVLTWSSGYQLLSATNVSGPYTPVSGATSPWTNTFTKPHEFFRVQGL